MYSVGETDRERDVGIICVRIYVDLALKAWTQSREIERERERQRDKERDRRETGRERERESVCVCIPMLLKVDLGCFSVCTSVDGNNFFNGKPPFFQMLLCVSLPTFLLPSTDVSSTELLV